MSKFNFFGYSIYFKKKNRNEKIIEMEKKRNLILFALREVSTQCKFAIIFLKKIIEREHGDGQGDLIWTSLFSLLNHSANVSKLLTSEDISVELRGLKIKNVLNINPTEILSRKFRNHIEHYDERLIKWIASRPKGVNIVDYSFGNKNSVKSSTPNNLIYVRFLDEDNMIFTFCDEELNLNNFKKELSEIQEKSEILINKIMRGNKIKNVEELKFLFQK